MSPLQKSQNTMTDITSLFVTAGINDIAFDAASDAWFRGIANRLIPESCQANPVYQNDSLVPSFGPSLVRIPCAASMVQCDDFATCPSGCIDMNSVMTNSASLANFLSKIAQRYSATPACVADLSEQFTVNYQNWFAPRTNPNTGIVSVQNRWLTTTSGKLDALQTNVNTLQQ